MITPVLLCGGSGTRLWPISRKSYPKQFVPLTGEKSLFTASAERLSGPDYAPPVIVTGSRGATRKRKPPVWNWPLRPGSSEDMRRIGW